jgi:hypothetical protein
MVWNRITFSISVEPTRNIVIDKARPPILSTRDRARGGQRSLMLTNGWIIKNDPHQPALHFKSGELTSCRLRMIENNLQLQAGRLAT